MRPVFRRTCDAVRLHRDPLATVAVVLAVAGASVAVFATAAAVVLAHMDLDDRAHARTVVVLVVVAFWSAVCAAAGGWTAWTLAHLPPLPPTRNAPSPRV